MTLLFSTEAFDPAGADIPGDHRRVLDHWDTLRDGRFAPAWTEFHLDELDPAIVPWCNAVDVIDGGADFRYRFWGTMRTEVQGQEMTSKSVRDLWPPELSESITAEYLALLERRRPTWFDTRASAGEKHETRYQFLRLPFSSDGETIDTIFAISHNRRGPHELSSLRKLGLVKPEA